MASQTETITAFLLGAILLISIVNEFVAGKINSNYQKQIEQDLNLSKAYGETSARWLELNEMLQRNIAAGLQGVLSKTVEESGKFNRSNFTDEKWEHWREKPVIDFWEHDYNKTWKALRKSLDSTNEERHNQENFIEMNKAWEVLGSVLRILQIVLIIMVLYMYGKTIW